jgi:hypothetical protein
MQESKWLQWETTIVVKRSWIFTSSKQLLMKQWPIRVWVLFPALMIPDQNG